MASGAIVFENGIGALKKAPVGFSWTTLFFGGFPALFRGHVGLGLIQIILQLVTLGFSAIVFSFIYNKMYAKYLIGEGFKLKEINGSKTTEELESWVGMSLKPTED